MLDDEDIGRTYRSNKLLVQIYAMGGPPYRIVEVFTPLAYVRSCFSRHLSCRAVWF